mgnify:FL=1
MKPFDYVNDINFKKKNLMRDSDNDKLAESGYIPYITNKSLSYFPDTLFFSNDMNHHHHLDNLLQYEYLLNNVRPKKRFAKWVKSEDKDDLEVIKMYYDYSNKKAEQALKILSSEVIEKIRIIITRGKDDERRVPDRVN